MCNVNGCMGLKWVVLKMARLRLEWVQVGYAENDSVLLKMGFNYIFMSKIGRLA